MEEKWTSIAGYEGRYEVSTFGKVRSLAQPGTKLSGTVLTPVKVHDYCYVTLCGNHAKKRYAVHRLVATAFIPNPQNKPEVNHKDGDKGNNAVDNLEWATHIENNKHAYAHGLMRSYDRTGAKNPMYGKHHGKSAKEKIAAAHRGRAHSEETKAKIGKAHCGRKFSDEHRKRLGESVSRAKKGTRWVNNGTVQRTVKPEIAVQLINQGWKYGKLKQ